MTERVKNRNRKNSRKILILLFVLFVLIFSVCCFLLLKDKKENSDMKKEYDDLKIRMQRIDSTVMGVSGISVSLDSENKTENVKEKKTGDSEQNKWLGRLKTENPDVRGWITCEGTNIDYPILQGMDNEYYLDHLYNGKKKSCGSIFMDFRNSGDFSDRNTVIYGHHMKTGIMFTSLDEYKSQEFYDLFPTMDLYTLNGNFKILLLSGTVENGGEDFLQFYFEDDDSFLSYVSSLQQRSTFKSQYSVKPGDRIVSLCTCSHERKNARFLVTGILIPHEKTG